MKKMVLTILAGILLICSGTDSVSGQQQNLNGWIAKEKEASRDEASRAYRVALSSAGTQEVQEKLGREIQVMDLSTRQQVKKQAEMRQKLDELKAELEAIIKLSGKKDTQKKLQDEIKELEIVLKDLQKSGSTSARALQNYIAVGKTLHLSKKEQDPAYRNIAAIEAAAANYSLTARNLTAGTTRTDSGGALVQSFTSSSRSTAGDVLVIPGRVPLDPEEYKLIVENMQIMGRILEKKLELETPSSQVTYNIYQSGLNLWNTTRTTGRIKSMYLQGFGTLFLMDVNFPLLAPVEKEPVAKKEVKDDVWEKVRQELKDPQRTALGLPITAGKLVLSADKKTTEEYHEEKVENLKKTLLEGLRHARNMGHLDDSEWMVIHITGAGRPIVEVIEETDEEVKTDKAIKNITISGDVNLNVDTGLVITDPRKGSIQTITFKPQTESEPTYMVIRAQKRDIDRFADGRLTFEEFVETVTVLIF